MHAYHGFHSMTRLGVNLLNAYPKLLKSIPQKLDTMPSIRPPDDERTYILHHHLTESSIWHKITHLQVLPPGMKPTRPSPQMSEFVPRSDNTIDKAPWLPIYRVNTMLYKSKKLPSVGDIYIPFFSISHDIMAFMFLSQMFLRASPNNGILN